MPRGSQRCVALIVLRRIRPSLATHPISFGVMPLLSFYTARLSELDRFGIRDLLRDSLLIYAVARQHERTPE